MDVDFTSPLYSKANLAQIDLVIAKKMVDQQISFTLDGDAVQYVARTWSELKAYRVWFAQMVTEEDPSSRPIHAVQLFGSKGL